MAEYCAVEWPLVPYNVEILIDLVVPSGLETRRKNLQKNILIY